MSLRARSLGRAWPLVLSLLACSSKLDLGRDRQPDLAAPTQRTAASCGLLPCFGGPVIELGVSPGSAAGLALDAQNVYWAATTGEALIVTPKSGGASTVVWTPAGGPFAVAVDAVGVYFTSGVGGYVASTQRAAPKTVINPNSMQVVMLREGEPEPGSVLVASEGVYFADQVGGALKRIDLDTLSATTLVTGIHPGSELALDASSLIYTDAVLGEIHQLDRVSAQDSLLLAGRAHPRAPLIRGEQLYFLEQGTEAAEFTDGRLLRIPRSGGPLEVLLEQLDAPTGLAADADSVYVCTGGTALNGHLGRIVRRADDGRVSTLAVNQAQPFAIAVDEQAVYFTVDGDSALRAIRR
jgi:sugar lactone lactonase YvrE